MESRTGIVLVSVPAFSHQVSILEFAKRLVDLHKEYCFHVTCIIPTISINNSTTPNSIFFDSLPPCIQCIFLPHVNFDDLRNEVSLESQMHISVSRSMPLVRQTLMSLSNVIALIADPFAYEALHFAKEFNILCYTYFPCSAMALSLCLYSSKLDQLVSCEYRDHPKPIEIPGCIAVEGIDLPDSVQDRSSSTYKLFLHRYQQLGLADCGIIVNSFMGMEATTIRAISEEKEGNGTPTVFPIGPIIQTRPNTVKNSWECLQWLDNQQPNSVLYISFGSGGTLSQEQINELALGLELSNHKFLWVNMRVPNNKASASYLSLDEMEDPIHFLPSGFRQRTMGQGFVMSGWAPQVEILKHNAIGAFLTHCGWNSILESIVHGVPMIAWPLFAEQKINAALVTDGLKVAVRPKYNSEGIVVKEDICCLVKGLVEGLESEELCWRMKELKKLAACAVMEDGLSTKTLSELALKWKSLGKSM